MKKLYLLFVFLLAAITAQAQFKVHDNGHVSIGSLTQATGIQVQPSGYVYFRTQNSSNYGWAESSLANANYQKHWIVENHFNHLPQCYGKQMFYVYGNGHACATNYLTIATDSINDTCYNNHNSKINGSRALETILNLNGCYYEHDPEMTPQEIENNEYIDENAVEGMINDLGKRTVRLSVGNLEEVFPEAVRTDPEARLCIDYNAVITMLTQAVKQQQVEIEELRTALKEHGILKQ